MRDEEGKEQTAWVHLLQDARTAAKNTSDHSWKMREASSLLTGASRKVLLQDESSQYWLFKPEQGQGGNALIPEHACAAYRIAELLGLRTPRVGIAQYRGERGILMKWDPEAITLDDAVAAGLCSEEEAWSVLNAEGAVLDWLIGNGDRKLAHGIVPHDAAFPPAREEVSFIDLDMAFAREEYGPDPPEKIPQELQQAARKLVRNPEKLASQVGTLLTSREYDCLLERLAAVGGGIAFRVRGGLHLF